MFGVTKTQRTIRSSRSGRRIFACEKKLWLVHRYIDDQNPRRQPEDNRDSHQDQHICHQFQWVMTLTRRHVEVRVQVVYAMDPPQPWSFVFQYVNEVTGEAVHSQGTPMLTHSGIATWLRSPTPLGSPIPRRKSWKGAQSPSAPCSPGQSRSWLASDSSASGSR